MQPQNERFSFDGEVEQHAPDLYDYRSTARGVTGFGAVGQEQIANYRRDGFLIIHEAFNSDEVEEAREGIRDLVAGKHSEFEGLQFSDRVREVFSTLSLEEKLDAIRKLYSFTEVEKRLDALTQHASLNAIVGDLIEAEPELYQSMALLKPPGGREKPWHQDHSHFDLPLETKVVGVWIALDEATLENGCMRFLPGWHRNGPMRHEQRRDFQIPDNRVKELIPESIAVPLEPGGCLLFDSLLPHGTPVNQSKSRRWAVQFHFLPVGTTRISHEERLRVFGS